MSVVAKFAKQTADLDVFTGRDGFSKATYAPTRKIKVRREAAEGVRHSATGTDVGVETYYLTEAIVTTNDKIDGHPVRRVKEITSAKGVRLGVEVWV